MKKISTLVVGIVVLTCFLFVNRVHAQTGPIAELELWNDSTNTLIDFDSVFFAISDGPNGSPQSDYNGFNFWNTGDEPLVFTIASSNPDFYCAEGPFTLPGDYNQFYMVFRPSKLGLSTGVITITTNDPNHEEIVFNVKGFGIEPPIDFSTEQFDLIVGTSVTKQMVVRNTTSGPAKFIVSDEVYNSAFNFIISKDGQVLNWTDYFVLEAGESTSLDLFFDFSHPDLGAEEIDVPILVQCVPLYYASTARTPMFIYKNFIVNGVFPTATIGAPSTVFAEVPISTITSGHFTITNFGNTELNYSIDTDSLLNESEGVRLSSTGFEELAPGIAHLQGGWIELDYLYVTKNHQWKVESVNPFSGTQHLRCTSNGTINGTNISLRAPEPEGNATIIDMMVDLDLAGGMSWEFVYSFGKLVVAPDGSLSVLPERSNSLESIAASLPHGYFNLRFAINDNQELIISADGAVIHEEILSYNNQFRDFRINIIGNVAGSIMDVDNFKFIDGSQVTRLLSVQSVSGSIPPSGSKTIEINYDTRNIDAGTYSEIFTIHSNDSVNPKVFVPVTTIVKPNVLPVLTGDFNSTMVSGDTIIITLGAIDPDDSLVSISWSDFDEQGNGDGTGTILETFSGNKFLAFSLTNGKSSLDYFHQLTIIAKDARGGITTRLLTVNVLASAFNTFSLTNFKTGVPVANFTDTIRLDIAHPDFDRLTVQANVYSDPYVSVKFILDGVEINEDKTWPYYLSSWTLPKLSEGYHTLSTRAYSNYGGEEFIISVGRTIIHVINSATITNYHVVNKDGIKIMDLVNGSVIDLSKTGSSINIIANESISTVRSVKFTLNNTTARIDNDAPYALGGNSITGDGLWKVKAGNYTLSATPYLRYFAWGPQGHSLAINFKVVNGTLSAPSPSSIARSASPVEEKQMVEVIESGNILSIYPVPVKDDLYIELHESVKGNVVLNVMNSQGQSVHLKAGNANEFRKYSISTVQLGISTGIYFVVINQENGGRIVKKFIKE